MLRQGIMKFPLVAGLMALSTIDRCLNVRATSESFLVRYFRERGIKIRPFLLFSIRGGFKILRVSAGAIGYEA